ncbi:hypothetical protein RJ640_020167 [Escallonia rubra]|uniref:Very-long-chain (3R)-3-hydroxyacyl-CoA dehydratase n=1 Tax=Escallonia rubra TaxID=112253 RepID=A0AA88R195_9ASTE|nr:hypothetical protein RJ640_020167 [Escallonia rubra]
MAGASSVMRRVYLALYNWAVFAGWQVHLHHHISQLQVLYLAVKAIKESGYEHVYDAVKKPLLLAQSAAVLEILHGLVGLVRSPITATLPQIASRLYVTWGILWSFPEVQTRLLVSSLVISWCISEIIRYSFFGTKEAVGSAPSWLLWLRYSAFLLLYPTGIASELGLVYTAMPFMKESGKYCIRMPNTWNFSFDYSYIAVIALGIYVPGMSIPHLYGYMLGQRKKALSKSKKE